MKRASRLPAKWLEEFAKATPDVEQIRLKCQERGLSEKTIADQLKRLSEAGIITTPDTAIRPTIVVPRRIRPVPKPAQLKG